MLRYAINICYFQLDVDTDYQYVDACCVTWGINMQTSVYTDMDSSSGDAPTYTPSYYIWTTASLLFLSVLLLTVGIKPGSLTGWRNANALGWLMGALIAPIVAIICRQHDQFLGKNPTHIRNPRILSWVTWYLVLSVILSIVHAGLYALERGF